MTKEVNAVRTYRIVYTSGSSPKAHEFTTDKPVVAQKQYEFLTSDNGTTILMHHIGLSILKSDTRLLFFHGTLLFTLWISVKIFLVLGINARCQVLLRIVKI